MMKNYYFLIALSIACVSCNSSVNVEEEQEPILRIYQVQGDGDEIITVELEDFTDGYGTMSGKLSAIDRKVDFDAIYDYVEMDRTIFSITAVPGTSSILNIHGSGFFTSDSIDILVTQEGPLGVFQEHFTGIR